MIQALLNLIQPLAFIIFLVAGLLCLIAKRWPEAWINLAIANANLAIFYSDKIFK